jgi:hypothetical protein
LLNNILKKHGFHVIKIEKRPIPVWTNAGDPVWVPVFVIDTGPESTSKKGHKMLGMKILILAGPPAGSLIHYNLPVGYIRYFLKEIGMPVYDRIHESEVYHTTFTAYICNDADRGRTVITRYNAGSAQRTHNRDLHKARQECNLIKRVECYRCPRGYDECAYAVRPVGYENRLCLNGHYGFFEKGVKSRKCIACRKSEQC